jgi:hypothetical protein
MKKAFTLIYVIAAAAYSLYAVTAELQPARFWIELFAPASGDSYPTVLVFLLTFLVFLVPLIVLLLFSIAMRKRKDSMQSTDGPGIWITRKRQLQSALVEIPIYINDLKAGGIDNGTIKFFPANPGTNIVHAGKGITASEKTEFVCSGTGQVYFRLEIVQSGLVAKCMLLPMAS